MTVPVQGRGFPGDLARILRGTSKLLAEGFTSATALLQPGKQL